MLTSPRDFYRNFQFKLFDNLEKKSRKPLKIEKNRSILQIVKKISMEEKGETSNEQILFTKRYLPW